MQKLLSLLVLWMMKKYIPHWKQERLSYMLKTSKASKIAEAIRSTYMENPY